MLFFIFMNIFDWPLPLLQLWRRVKLTAPPSEILMPLFCHAIFLFFLPPSPYIPAGVLVLLVCERLGSLLDERISLCTFRSPLQGLVPLQTNEETRGFAPNLSVRNSGPSSSWRRLNNCSLSVSRAFIISRSWDTFTLLPMMYRSFLSPLNIVVALYTLQSRAPTLTFLCVGD